MRRGRIIGIFALTVVFLLLSSVAVTGILLLKNSDDSIKKDISEYENHFSRNGNQYLISGFGTEEYECSGTCYCDSSRKALPRTAVSKVSYFLVAAVSTIIAMKKATEYFSEECSRIMPDDFCPPETTIASSVDKCESVRRGKSKASEQVIDYYEGTMDLKTGKSKTIFKKKGSSFTCRGSCLAHHLLRSKFMIKKAEGYGCRKFEMTSDLHFPRHPPEKLTKEKVVQVVGRFFQKKHLGRFCKESSKVYGTGFIKRGMGKSLSMYEAYMCGAGLLGKNPTVKCYRSG